MRHDKSFVVSELCLEGIKLYHFALVALKLCIVSLENFLDTGTKNYH